VNIRKAIAHAINREEIIGFTTYGQASINSSGVPAAHPSHTVIHDKWYEFSPDKSRALLKKAGYRGQLIKIQTNRKHPGMYNNALVVQAMLQAVGINCQLELLDWASQLNNYYSGDFQLMTFSFSAIANPTLRYSKLIGLKDRRPNSQWDSRKADDLIRKVRMNDNPEQINQIYEDIHQLMIEEIPIIGLYNARISSGTTKNISGFSPWPLELVRLWGVSVD
jgi:peptide/nickel transport system substrate-binding protein